MKRLNEKEFKRNYLEIKLSPSKHNLHSQNIWNNDEVYLNKLEMTMK